VSHTNIRFYETTFIVDGNLTDEAITPVVEKFKKLVADNATEVVNVNDQGRKKLAYKIGKAATGYFVHIEFKGSAGFIKELERQYRLDESIVRFLTILLDKRLLEMRERVAKYSQLAAEAAAKAAEAV
jgi:small subunit ribosomal protein S6